MTRRLAPAFVLTAALGATLAPAAQANLLSNGSFESPDLTASHCYLSSTDRNLPLCSTTLGGWTGRTPVIQSGNSAWGGLSALAGEQYVGLQFVASNNIYGQISQQLALGAGQYTLTWQDAGRGNYGGAATYQVLYNGLLLDQESVAVGQGWTQRSVSFTTPGANAMLAFTAIGGSYFDSTAFIDAVSMVRIGNASSVPEPASLALVALALAGVVGARRRG